MLAHSRGIEEVGRYHNAIETLEALKAQGARSFIVTHRGQSTYTILQKLNMLDYFEEIITSKSAFPRKPAPDAINYLIEKHGLEKKNTYYVGDRTIDLRSEQETIAKPSAFAKESDFTFFHYPIEEGMLPPNSLEEVPLSYMEIAHVNCMKEVFKTIANAKGGVLFHCTAGKDRTGVVSAILLALAGVSDEDIIYDYVISREFNKLRLEAFLKEHPEIDIEIVLANPKSMLGFLEMLRGKHHSVEQYLLNIGIASNEIHSLKNKLVKEG